MQTEAHRFEVPPTATLLGCVWPSMVCSACTCGHFRGGLKWEIITLKNPERVCWGRVWVYLMSGEVLKLVECEMANRGSFTETFKELIQLIPDCPPLLVLKPVTCFLLCRCPTSLCWISSSIFCLLSPIFSYCCILFDLYLSTDMKIFMFKQKL